MEEKEIDILKQRLESLELENAALTRKVAGFNILICWLRGYDDIPDTLFEPPSPDAPLYWWRKPLKNLADRVNNDTLIA